MKNRRLCLKEKKADALFILGMVFVPASLLPAGACLDTMRNWFRARRKNARHTKQPADRSNGYIAVTSFNNSSTVSAAWRFNLLTFRQQLAGFLVFQSSNDSEASNALQLLEFHEFSLETFCLRAEQFYDSAGGWDECNYKQTTRRQQ
ncbi:hypothetical protein OUZ56_007276 [Daphnia magna]|uniref:Secreted protein n=1 Tax=Daphnia magna TaxID=35525 RepID=A0ABQ9YY93_9CRUS|nr:hypothetical protein OUZ56_007276 [Daphnia magna]